MTDATTPPEDPLALEAQVCFALSAGARGMVAMYRPLLEPLGVTHPQYLVLLALWQDDAAGTTTTVTALADRLHLDPGTLSPLLKRLDALGYVRRARSAADARQVHVTLTDQGRARRADAERIPPAIVAATGLSLDELAQVHAAAAKVVAAAARAGAY
ncbi:MarR family winged helix-turn-helix transcriptional regulator [Cellulosimicrobium marinum]|uniref:MarR family winged helix-turn-helix transcriptional regulator n=1 Tax=Cellulosimicrobium marinum TaxID=1638992 RepID=UPI001E52576A|nr:MarR family winged helix-turn-helix transcriptional regulator [Cellulosimicrobium marinum]MCB7135277.1 MarR family winged helix-turn-helix transcriptional regulator [Cellulosimicrobium marinum]